MEDVHVIFTMLRCTLVWVTNFGQLVGCIARDDLIRANQHKHSHRGDAVAATKRPSATQQPLAAAAMEAALSVVVDPDGPKGEARS